MNREVICFDAVAPVRERGLKYSRCYRQSICKRRSREGARIEIWYDGTLLRSDLCRSREGARIEMLVLAHMERMVQVAPVRERGLKFCLGLYLRSKKSRSREGARIEIAEVCSVEVCGVVAPVRERGLKSLSLTSVTDAIVSLP